MDQEVAVNNTAEIIQDKHLNGCFAPCIMIVIYHSLGGGGHGGSFMSLEGSQW